MLPINSPQLALNIVRKDEGMKEKFVEQDRNKTILYPREGNNPVSFVSISGFNIGTISTNFKQLVVRELEQFIKK